MSEGGVPATSPFPEGEGRKSAVSLILPPSTGFRPDARFGAVPPPPEPEAADPVAAAFDQGYVAGYDDAERIAADHAAAEAAARERLALSFARLDAVLEDELRQRLRDTVSALC